jgi:hypothetical protein
MADEVISLAVERIFRVRELLWDRKLASEQNIHFRECFMNKKLAVERSIHFTASIRYNTLFSARYHSRRRCPRSACSREASLNSAIHIPFLSPIHAVM